ncbi:MAG: hypothetical protein M3R04_01660, partial [bacterium]|nr:hypothetical protein [bacterium]
MSAISRCWLLASLTVFIATAAQAFEPPAMPESFPDNPPAWASLPQPNAAEHLARNSAGASIAVKPIDDPANPYAGQYGAFDRWLHEHYVPALSPEEQKFYPGFRADMREAWTEFRAQYPEHWAFLRGKVDEQGWQVPARTQSLNKEPETAKTIREYVTAQQQQSKSFEERIRQQNEMFYFDAVGMYTPELREQIKGESYRRLAPEYPAIPAWLGSNPPLQTVFVPNGEILTYGPLGLHVTSERERQRLWPDFPPGETWYRYSTDGKLLGTQQAWPGHRAPDTGWAEVYHDWREFNVQLRTAHEDWSYVSTLPGGIRAYSSVEEVRNPETPGMVTREPREAVAAFDFDGHWLDLDAPIDLAKRHLGTPTGRSTLSGVFAAQIELGLTRAYTLSPHTGTPEGPAVVDPTPRAPKLFAYRMPPEAKLKGFYGGDDNEYLEVRA